MIVNYAIGDRVVVWWRDRPMTWSSQEPATVIDVTNTGHSIKVRFDRRTLLFISRSAWVSFTDIEGKIAGNHPDGKPYAKTEE